MHKETRSKIVRAKAEKAMGEDYFMEMKNRDMNLEIIAERLTEDCFVGITDRLDQICILADRLYSSERYYDLYKIFTTMVSAGISDHIEKILSSKPKINIFDYDYGRDSADESTLTIYGLIIDIIGFQTAISIIEKVENPKGDYNLPEEKNEFHFPL